MNMRVGGPHILEDHAVPPLANAFPAPHLARRFKAAILQDDFRVVELVAADAQARREKRVGTIYEKLRIAVALRRAAHVRFERKHAAIGYLEPCQTMARDSTMSPPHSA